MPIDCVVPAVQLPSKKIGGSTLSGSMDEEVSTASTSARSTSGLSMGKAMRAEKQNRRKLIEPAYSTRLDHCALLPSQVLVMPSVYRSVKAAMDVHGRVCCDQARCRTSRFGIGHHI